MKRAEVDRQEVLLSPKFFLGMTRGLVLSQITEITGTHGSLLQNWVRRGWLARPCNKRYSLRHLERIFLINLLRNIVPLENITAILTYINGDVSQEEDDIIEEGRLYYYVLETSSVACNINISDEEAVSAYLEKILKDYMESIPGSREKILRVLKIVLFASHAKRMKMKAVEMASLLES